MHRGSKSWVVALAAVVACACAEPAELPVWSCPVEPQPGPGWPLWVGTVYAPRASLPSGAVVTATRGDETLGSATVRSDGSLLLPLRSHAEETLAGARVELSARHPTLGTMRRWVRVAEPAATRFYRYGQSCASSSWVIDARLAIHPSGETVAPLERGLGVSMLGPGESTPALGPVGVRTPIVIETPCAEPWFFFARHLDGRVSGCWDYCPPGETVCGGCTRLDWAAGRCTIGPPEPVEPDAGPPDAGRADAGPPSPPD